MEKERFNFNPDYRFLNNRDFLLIEKNLGRKFDSEDIVNIDKLLKAEKGILIENFHNLFSLNEDKSLAEVEASIKRGLPDKETTEIYQIFHYFLSKYGWHICLNLESFVEQYK